MRAMFAAFFSRPPRTRLGNRAAEVRASLKLSPFYKKDAHLRDYDPAKVSAFAWSVEKPIAPVPAQ